MSGVLSSQDLASMLGCSVTTVEFKAREGLLPGLKFGDGGWVFPLESTLKRLNEVALEESLKRLREKAPDPVAVHITQYYQDKLAGRRRKPVFVPEVA